MAAKPKLPKMKLTILDKEDITDIPHYDEFTKQEIHIIQRLDGAIWYKVIQDDKVIEYQQKYKFKKGSNDHKTILVTFYAVKNGQKTFSFRIIFLNEKSRALFINDFVQRVRTITTQTFRTPGYNFK